MPPRSARPPEPSPCSSRTASRPCGWPTSSSSSPTTGSWSRARTRSSLPMAACTPSCSGSRRRPTADRPARVGGAVQTGSAPGGTGRTDQQGDAWTTARHARPRRRPSTSHGSSPSASCDHPTWPPADRRWPSASRRSIARKVVAELPDADVRRTGRIKTLAADEDRRVRPRPPVITARSLGETGRVRPLRPGISIAHVDVTAGTLGAFVQLGGLVHVLSNYHVLSGTPQAKVGDVIVQPGPADGGRAPRDKVGTLAARVELEPGGDATVDCAIALLDDQEVDPEYPVGLITTTAVTLGDEKVAKIGRTTSVTHGRVTAIELDN